MNQQTGIFSSIRRIVLVVGGGLLLMLVTAAAAFRLSRTVKATVVKVEPLDGNVLLIDSADVVKLVISHLGENPDGKPINQLDPDRIERFLEQDPFVRNAEVAITANNRLDIRVEQRRPLLRIIDSNGLQYYLDEQGHRVPLSPHFTARTLVATGQIPPFTADFIQRKRHVLKDLYTLARFIESDPVWLALFEQVYVNSRNEYVLVPKVGDQLVIVGSADELDSKFRRLRIFYTEALSREGWQKYSTIDLRWRGQVVCERR